MLRRAFPDLKLRTLTITTTADSFENVPLHKISGKGFFVKEIDEALIEGRIDFAVHSMKDVPTELPQGIGIVATPPRKSPNEVLFTHTGKPIEKLPEGAIIGSGSFRRIAYLKRFREDLLAKPIRGNVDTRIRKVQERKYDGVILAEAGLQRLGLTNYITQRFSLNEFLPAAGQGILAVTARKDDGKTLQVLRRINDEKTFTEAVAERAFIRTIGGGCKVPIGANTTLKRNNLILEGEILSLNGKQSLKARISGSLNEAEFIGEKLAYQLLNSGGETLIKKVVKEIENLGPKSP